MEQSEAPEGFHFRGQAPTWHGDPKMISKLALFHPNETDKTTKESKYGHCFIRINDDGGSPQVLCLCCSKKYKLTYCKSSGSLDLGNFWKHLKEQHPTEMTPIDQAKKPEEKKAGGQLTSESWSPPIRSPSVSNKHKIGEALAKMICDKGTISIESVECPDLHAAVRTIVKLFCKEDPKIDFPSANTVRRMCDVYLTYQEKLDRETFVELRGNRLIAITNDSTTSVAKKGYTCLSSSIMVTRPLVWEILTTVLNCLENKLDVSHTAVHNFNQLEDAMSSYIGVQSSLESVVWGGTFDCGGNTPRAGCLDVGISAFKCYDHRLSTLLGHMDQLDAWVTALAPVYATSEAVRRSGKNCAELERVQPAPTGRSRKKLPVNGAKTRWTFHVRALRRAVFLFPFFKAMDVEKMYFKDNTKKREWQRNLGQWQHHSQYFVEYMLPLLERVEKWTLCMESSRSVTISLCIYATDDLRKYAETLLADVHTKQSAFPAAVLSGLRDVFYEFDRQLDSIFHGQADLLVLQVAEQLDIRVAVPCEYRKNRQPLLEDLHESNSYYVTIFLRWYDVSPLAKSLYATAEVVEAVVPIGPGDAPAAAGAVAAAAPYDPFAGPPGAVGGNNIEAAVANVTRAAFVRECLDYHKYLQDDWKAVPDEQQRLNRDPLVVQWPKIASRFPMLAKAAAAILSGQASAAFSESIFSVLASVVTKGRSALNAQFAGRIVANKIRMRKKTSRKVVLLPNFGKLDKAIVLDEWDPDEDDDDYDADDEEIQSDGEDDDDFVDEEEEGKGEGEEEKVEGDGAVAGRRIRQRNMRYEG